MTDLEILKKIEIEQNIKLSNIDKIDLINKNPNVKEYVNDSYILDNANNVISLKISVKVDLEKIVSNLKGLKKLTELDLSKNNFTDISALKELNKLKVLKLSNNNISDISPLKEMYNLENLILSGNKIKDLPQLTELKKLTRLNISNNELVDISPLKKNNNLQQLDLSFNKIKDTFHLELLNNLESLSLRSNELKDISPLNKLIQIRNLDLAKNQITDITSLKGLSNLKTLDLSSNQLNNIVPLKNFKNLERLYLNNNKIIDFSPIQNLDKLAAIQAESNRILNTDFLSILSNLYDIRLRNNQINNLEGLSVWYSSSNMIQKKRELEILIDLRENPFDDISPILPALKNTQHDIIWKNSNHWGKIYLFNNPLKTPPAAIVQEGKEAIINYFSQIKKEKGKTEYLFEAKLLVIGDGGTGKTTFSRKMQNIKAKMPLAKDTTLGIEVNKWNYKIDFPRIPPLKNVNFNVNLWDFGGQRVYQGTHQIFFSDKSFYVLLADTREQKTDFSYWLNTVEQLGGENSSLIIVLNKKLAMNKSLTKVATEIISVNLLRI